MEKPVITKERRLIIRGSSRSAAVQLTTIHDALMLADERPDAQAFWIRNARIKAETAVREATMVRDFLRAAEATACRAMHTGGPAT